LLIDGARCQLGGALQAVTNLLVGCAAILLERTQAKTE